MYITYLIFLILNIACYTETSYIDIISNSVKKYSEISKDSLGNRMKYKMAISYRNSHNISKQSFEILYKGSKIKLICDDYQYYGDSLVAILVYPENKEIYALSKQGYNSRIQNISNMITILDSIIKSSELVDFHYQGENAHIRLLLKDNISPPYNSAELTYIIDTLNNEMEYVKIEYANQDYQIKELEISFLLNEKVSASDFFDLPLGENIFDSEGKLREEYKDFNLITK